jgi:hypothetical protein
VDADSLPIAAALAGLGIQDPASVAAARAVLDQEGVTNPRRARLSTQKVSRLAEVVRARFSLHCPSQACGGHAVATGLPGLVVRKDACPWCQGSNTRLAAQTAAEACARAGIRSVCLVGGSPGVREGLERQLGTALRLTLVDGTQTPDSRKARAHVRGHDLTVICGSSELSHKLSGTYQACASDGVVITVARRGVEAIVDAVATHARRRAAPPR